MVMHQTGDRARHRRAIGTFPKRRAAEQALHELRDSGFPMDRVSLITRDSDQQSHGAAGAAQHTKLDEGAKTGAAAGGVLGTLTGLLVGLGSLAIPGVGPIMLAGATATALATTLAGTAIGAIAGGLLGALIGLGIPEADARGYHDRIMRGEYLIIVDGTDAEIARAEQILRHRGIEAYKVYDAPASGHAPIAPVPLPLHTAHPDPRIPHTVASSQRQDAVDVSRSKHAIARFADGQDVEAAIRLLHQAGFPLSQVAVITRQINRWESLAGLDLRDRFETARYGVPADQAQQYDAYLDHGEILLIISGSEQDVQRAMEILGPYGVTAWNVYDPMLVNPAVVTADDAVVSSATTASTGAAKAITMPAPPPPPSMVAATRPTTRPQYSHRAIGVFTHRPDTEAALTNLRNIGFPMDQISLLAKDSSRSAPVSGVDIQQKTGNKADEGAKVGAAGGAALGGLGGLLVGLGTLAIPGVGPVVLGGAAATAIATTLSGGVLGAAAGGLVGALVGLGIPEHRARVYHDHFNRGHDLVIVDGSDTEIYRAEAILKQHRLHEWEMYDARPHTSMRSQTASSRKLGDRSTTRENQRLGIDEGRGDRLPSDAQVISTDPDVIIIDRRHNPR